MKVHTNRFLIGIMALFCLSSCYNDSSVAPSANGVGGSMARFAITGDYLYTVDTRDLKVFDISAPANPEYSKDIKLGWGIETIFPYQQKLFIGSQNGMYIYDIANPLNPQYISMYQHITSCDPVVVQDSYAYVTLRNGTDCRLGQNLLDVLDISNPNNPTLISSISMLNPHGLAVKNNHLYVCEGDHGFKVFNIDQPKTPQLLTHMTGFNAFDVIALPHVLIITGSDGIYQYTYNDVAGLKQLSVIPVNKDL